MHRPQRPALSRPWHQRAMWLMLWLPWAAVAAAESAPAQIDQEWRDRVVMGYHADGLRNLLLADKKAKAALKAANASGDTRARLHAAIQALYVGDAWNNDCKFIDEYLSLAKSGGDKYLGEVFDLSIPARNPQRTLCATELPVEEIEALARRLGDPARMFYALDAKATDAARANRYNDAMALLTEQLAYAITDFQAVAALMNLINYELSTHPKSNKSKDMLKMAFDRLGTADFPSLRGSLDYFVMSSEAMALNIDAALAKAKDVEVALRYEIPGTPNLAIKSLNVARVLRLGHRPREALAMIEKIPPVNAANEELAFATSTILMEIYTELGTEDVRQKGMHELQRLSHLLANPVAANPRVTLNAYQAIAAFHEKYGDYKAALLARKEADKARERRQKLANEATRVEFQEKLNVAAKEQENARLKADADLQAARQRGWMLAFGAAAVGVAAAGAALGLAVRRGRRLSRVSAELAQRNGELEERSASRVRLLAAACHDLRQPAHALGMLAELGSEAQRDPSRFVAWLQSVRRSTASLGEMLDELMDLGRLDGGQYTPLLGDVSLAELMHDVMLHFGGLARRKGLTLEVPPAEGWVVSDRHLLRRILFNLVSNAIKYTDAGFVRVSVSRGPGAGSVRLRVQDSGPGIPPEKLEDVFRDYVRLNPAKAAEGLGIGLSIVRRASELLGHELVLASPPGEGTSATLTLALSAAPAPAPPIATAPSAACTAKGVLALMEDDADVREAMAALLAQWGYTVKTGTNAQSVHQQLREAQLKPDLIVTDLHLGSTDGLTEVTRLRQQLHAHDLPALLVTGDLDATIATQAAQTRVYLVHKPLAPTRLAAVVSQLLAARVTRGLPATQGH